jgi:hypothetical protein
MLRIGVEPGAGGAQLRGGVDGGSRTRRWAARLQQVLLLPADQRDRRFGPASARARA